MENELKKESIAFESLSINQSLEALKTNKENGLTSEEAKARLEKFGPNKLQEKKKKSWIRIFFEQMANPMIYVLFAAIAVTIGISIYETISAANAGWIVDGNPINNPFLEVGDWPDVIIIVAVIIMNSVIGTIQEVKAATSLEALKNMSSPESTVIRDGKKFRVKSSELVIGDIVYLEEGDTIGADIRLIEAVNLKANESSLTGESVPVEKNADITFSSNVAIGDRVNMVYMSTPVSYGRGLGVVVATGMDTQIGKIASALDEEEEQTPLQKTLAKLSKFLGILTLIIIAVVLIVDIIWLFVDGNGSKVESWIEAVLSAIALAVAAIPEGLAAVVTIVLSIGVQRMVKANTIVRKLPSVETLGSVSVVCSDKTGTLTQNKMTVLEAYINHEYHKKDEFREDSKDESLRLLASGMSLCSNATLDNGAFGDPTEICLVEMANLFNMHKKDLEDKAPRIDELPFDSVRKMMSTKHKTNNGVIVYTKGAFDSIISRSTRIYDNGKIRKITKNDIEKITSANKEFSNKALRVLALAYKDIDEEKINEEDLIFVGLVAMIDPPREEAKPAVKTFKDAGIVTIMITGDHKDTAFAIAKELGIASDIKECYTGADVDKLSEEELKELVKTARVFARVSPENKTQIVKAFKANGNICAMTGDGVNDAPSLKAADIGIAMGITGTDVAKGAADMVLTDDNFASIEKAVEEGRGIYANIKKTVIFLLSSNIAEVLAMLFIIIVGLPAPLVAIHLLWVNLATDSLPAIALGMDKKDPNNMKEKPRGANETLFSHGGFTRTFFYGAVITIAVVLAYFMPAWLHGTFGIQNVKALYEDTSNGFKLQAQTMAFTALAFSELFHMIGMSVPNDFAFKVFKNKNLMMALAFIFGVGLQLLVIEVPAVRAVFGTSDLEPLEWMWTAILSVSPLIIHEIVVLIKLIVKKIKQRKSK